MEVVLIILDWTFVLMKTTIMILCRRVSDEMEKWHKFFHEAK